MVFDPLSNDLVHAVIPWWCMLALNASVCYDLNDKKFLTDWPGKLSEIDFFTSLGWTFFQVTFCLSFALCFNQCLAMEAEEDFGDTFQRKTRHPKLVKPVILRQVSLLALPLILILKTINGRESTVNRALDGSIYPC